MVAKWNHRARKIEDSRGTLGTRPIETEMKIRQGGNTRNGYHQVEEKVLETGEFLEDWGLN